MLDHVSSFKGETKRVNNKNVDHNLDLIAHKRSGLGSYFVLNNLPTWRKIVSNIRNGAGNVSLKIFNCYVEQK